MRLKETENDFNTWLLDAFHLFGWHTAHFRVAKSEKGWRTPVSGDGKGFPDWFVVRGKRVLMIEAKSDKGKLSPEQKQWFEWLKDTPIERYVWRPKDRKIIEEILK